MLLETSLIKTFQELTFQEAQDPDGGLLTTQSLHFQTTLQLASFDIINSQQLWVQPIKALIRDRIELIADWRGAGVEIPDVIEAYADVEKLISSAISFAKDSISAEWFLQDKTIRQNNFNAIPAALANDETGWQVLLNPIINQLQNNLNDGLDIDAATLALWTIAYQFQMQLQTVVKLQRL